MSGTVVLTYFVALRTIARDLMGILAIILIMTFRTLRLAAVLAGSGRILPTLYTAIMDLQTLSTVRHIKYRSANESRYLTIILTTLPW